MHYWALFEHYLHFCKQEWLKDWRKPELSRTIAICLLWKPFSAQVLCIVTVCCGQPLLLVKINIGQGCNMHWRVIVDSMPCRLWCALRICKVLPHWKMRMRMHMRISPMPYVQCMLNNRVNIMKVCSTWVCMTGNSSLLPCTKCFMHTQQ